MAFDPTFEKIGTPEAPASNSPFSLRDAGSVWIIERGRLDLFLVSGLNGQPTGARYPVMRVEEGEAVFGVGENVAVNAQLIASVNWHRWTGTVLPGFCWKTGSHVCPA